MSEAKFTKGEWSVSGCGLSVNANGYKVARAHSGSNTPYTDPAKANAHLIAAAPEMYEMLSDFLSMDSLDVKLLLENSSCVSDLLAKARGENN